MTQSPITGTRTSLWAAMIPKRINPMVTTKRLMGLGRSSTNHNLPIKMAAAAATKELTNQPMKLFSGTPEK